MIRKGKDARGQPFTMIKDRNGTRYEWPEGENTWSRFTHVKNCNCEQCENMIRIGYEENE
tara:strand:+ start:1305 stop:1484 length:180 start_codon:yes stop_codon:yes gene_type:complete